MTHTPLLECIPNLSEGRNHKALDQLWEHLQRIPQLYCLHQHRDADHHRSVLTLAGTPTALTEAVHRLYDWSAQHIDLRHHQGAHPRMGAVDVCPFVLLEGMTPASAVAFSHGVAREVSARWQVPVFFYEQSAVTGKEHRLPMLRRQWRTQGTQALHTADIGADCSNATLGATVMGVRGPLIAWNVWLQSEDLALAQQIAFTLRESNGGFGGLRALGLYLPEARQVQISMNVFAPERCSLFAVFQRIEALTQAAGVAIDHTEFIGLVPESAFFDVATRFFQATPALAAEHGLNTRLRTVKNRDFHDFFA